MRWVFNHVVFILNVPLQTSTEEDTSYSPVSDKEKEDPQNGTYIGLTPKADPQAWGGREDLDGALYIFKPQNHEHGFGLSGERKNSTIENCQFCLYNWKSQGDNGVEEGNIFLVLKIM